MDFCIADAVEELEENRELSDASFFSKNFVTFIDFTTFEEQYLTSYEYNDPVLCSFRIFTLQPRENLNLYHSSNDSEVKLR